ncbi:putative hemolysin [Psittacicella gerlachiana]|uniref:Hemolysin n=1 Tax=Psittacicella gerlachiana TaxID=2028574 RepID=A0A3A1YJ48_9GAMM|nr:DUF333 domain-containing protein [Psittacicella gerlachiana]RIY36047.1 hypothetical protein CKF59_02980 [Psittacicella gerlachiana]
MKKLLFGLGVGIILTACTNNGTVNKVTGQNHTATTADLAATKSPEVGMANPASLYCEKQGGRVEIIQDARGGWVGMCHLPNGTVVEEWQFYRQYLKTK